MASVSDYDERSRFGERGCAGMRTKPAPRGSDSDSKGSTRRNRERIGGFVHGNRLNPVLHYAVCQGDGWAMRVCVRSRFRTLLNGLMLHSQPSNETCIGEFLNEFR